MTKFRLDNEEARGLFKQGCQWVEQAIPEAVLSTGLDLRYVGALLTLRYKHGPGKVTPNMVRERFAALYGESNGG